ncbi:MAG: biopolymer transporter ExbD [Bacteroidota bacterium]|nr:biopolymer transporter ExbD [Bacteroidota bacterium]
MKFEQRHTINPNFNYATLPDMLLQLLVFFLLASSFVTFRGVNVLLPKAQSGEVQPDQQTIITMTENGRIYLNAEQVTTSTLAQKLVPIIDRNKNQVIIVRADKAVKLQQAVEIIDMAKGIGAQRFMIATEPAEEL